MHTCIHTYVCINATMRLNGVWAKTACTHCIEPHVAWPFIYGQCNCLLFFLICIWLFVIVNDPKILNCQWRKPLTLAQLHSERLRHYGSQQQKHTKVCKILAFGFIGKSTWSPCTIDQINSCTHCEIEKWKMELYVCMCVWRMEKRMVLGAQRINDYRTHGSKQICYNP